MKTLLEKANESLNPHLIIEGDSRETLENAVEHHLTQYHLHNIAWNANEKIGDEEAVKHHIDLANQHHTSALAFHRELINNEADKDDPNFKSFTFKKSKIKNDVHNAMREDLM